MIDWYLDGSFYTQLAVVCFVASALLILLSIRK